MPRIIICRKEAKGAKLEKHVVYIYFLSFLVLTVKEFNSVYFPFLLLATLLLFLNYALRFKVKEIIPGVTVALIALGISSLFHQSSENHDGRKVLWVKEFNDDFKVALLEGGKSVKLKEEAFPGDTVNLDGKLVKRNPLSVDRLRYEIYKNTEQKIDYPISALVGATTLGVKYELPPSIKSYFSLTGIYHFLAISGLHIGIVVGFLSLFLRILKIRKPLTVSSLLILPFLPLTGLPPSAMRAYLFTLLLSLGIESYRKVTPLYILGVILLLTAVFGKLNLSAVLSFTAVGGILVAIEGKEEKWKKFLNVSFAPAIFTLPVTLATFGTFNLLSWLNTFVTGLIFTPFVLFSFLHQITLGKFELINRITEILGCLLVESSHPLFNLTKNFIVHCQIPVFVSGLTMVSMLFLAFFSKPIYSFIPPLVLLTYAFFFPTTIANREVTVNGKTLNSPYFISSSGQSYGNCTIKSPYVFPYTRKLLFKNKLYDLRVKFTKIHLTKSER